MKRVLYVFLILSAHCYSQAPAIQWQKSLGGMHEENAYSALQTPDGGYIFAGRANSPDGDVVGYSWGQHNPFYGDAWIVKTDAVGTIQWQKVYGGFYNDGATKIINTPDGGYLVSCNSESSNGTVANHIGNYDYWILKLNNLGEIQWQRNLGGTSEDLCRDILVTADGGYIAIGTSSSNLPNRQGLKDVYLVKMNSSGTTQWWKNYGGSNDDTPNSIQQTADGGYIIAGHTKSSNGTFTVNRGLSDIFLLKINATGGVVWQKTMGGTDNDFGHSLIVLADGSYMLAAASASTNGDVTTVNRGSTDLWLVKMDSEANILWQKSYGGSMSEYYDGCKISQTSEGGFIVVGSAYSNNGDCTGGHSYNSADFWVVKLDNLGNKQWHRCLGGNADDYGRSIIETTDRGYLVSGTSRPYIINPQGADWTPSPTERTYDAWLIKLNPDPLLATSEKEMALVTLFPNPASSVVNVALSDATPIEKITVTDLMGKTVLEQYTSQPIAIGHLTKGLYIITAFADGRYYNTKFLKE